MTNDKAERIERIQAKLKQRLPTGAELLKRLERHKLPGTVEEIELGQSLTETTDTTIRQPQSASLRCTVQN